MQFTRKSSYRLFVILNQLLSSSATQPLMNAEPYPLHPVVNNVPNHTSPTLSRSDTITAPTSGMLYDANKKHNMNVDFVTK